jgi:hypothetical protein
MSTQTATQVTYKCDACGHQTKVSADKPAPQCCGQAMKKVDGK